jgi:hypothetical protein
MTTLQNFCDWLNELPWSKALSESDDAFPVLETLHVLSMSLIVGTVVTVDLRVTGLILRSEPVTRVVRALLPGTWIGFGIMVFTGLPLFASEAAKLYGNPAFRLKLLLLGLAGLNALMFHVVAYRRVAQWDQRPAGPPVAKALAALSIVLWAGVIVSGRMIAISHGH